MNKIIFIGIILLGLNSCKPLKKIDDIYPTDKSEPSLILGTTNTTIAWEDSIQAIDENNNSDTNKLFNISFELDQKMGTTGFLQDYTGKKTAELLTYLKPVDDLKLSGKNKADAAKTADELIVDRIPISLKWSDTKILGFARILTFKRNGLRFVLIAIKQKKEATSERYALLHIPRYDDVDNYFGIYSIKDLIDAQKEPFYSYKLRSDLEFPGKEEYNANPTKYNYLNSDYGTNGFKPLVLFGKIDGGKKVISNLWIQRPTEDSIAFINSEIRGVKNLQLLNFNIVGRNYVFGLSTKVYEGTVFENNLLNGRITGENYVAGLTLRQTETQDIRRIDSNITISATGSEVGGLVVEQKSGLIELVHVGGDIVGTNNVGGIAANQKLFGDIKDSYATVFVRGNENVGGISGNAEGLGSNLLFDGDLDCSNNCGVILGKFEAGAEYRNSYYPRRLTTVNQNAAMGLVINPKFTKESFSGFIFSDKGGPWNFVSGEMPRFKQGIFDFAE